MKLENEYWQAALKRDKQYDGKFVFAVLSTGIYCRPTCPSRRPRREQVRFFARAAQAERDGFRACKRCQPGQVVPYDSRLELMEEVCRYLLESHEHTVTLVELSRKFHTSPFHLQRTFKRLVGVTPRQYASANRMERFKKELKRGKQVTSAIYEAGYQSSSGVYSRAVERLGMTPTSYRSGGAMTKISYSIAECPLGLLLVASTDKGICAARLGDSEAELEAGLYREFPSAEINRDEVRLGKAMGEMLRYLNGKQPHPNLPLDLRATAFQRRVYQALQAIPYGSTRTYKQVAKAIGRPKAARAVGHACATNPVALLIPCHRVLRSDGNLGGYSYGLDRKRKLIDQEARITNGSEGMN